MRVTVCELSHQPGPLAVSWASLCEHTRQHRSELVLLPEFAFVEPVWETDRFDSLLWATAEATCNTWLRRLPELQASHVVGARPVSL